MAGITLGAMVDMTMGDRLKRLRIERGLDQYDLARLTADVKPPTISRIERGVTENPGQHTIRQLAEALGVSVDYLLAGDEVAVVDAADQGPVAIRETDADYTDPTELAPIRVPKRADQESLADIARALLSGPDPEANLRRFEKFRSYGEAGMDAILDLAEDALRLQRLRTEGTGGPTEEEEPPAKRRKRKINLGPEDLDAQKHVHAN